MVKYIIFLIQMVIMKYFKQLLGKQGLMEKFKTLD